ncbi:hypothetical protein J2W97_001217 [Paenibacillus jamilae]|nr:hypothetical protein [Paenibacillus jamilae]
MYMMFVYVNGVAHNHMGIRGDLEELHVKAADISKEYFRKDSHAEISTKITKYI